ncbi:MAG: flavin-containing monooxygenase [Acidimicrobiales bacterium]
MTTSLTAQEPFDPTEIRRKYRAERDKRLRAEGNDQYVEIRGEFARYLDDPYTPPALRAPLTDTVEVAVIGGGFGGLLAGARLRQAGIEDLRVIEAGGDFGGTWYWNRYPGAACDVESYIYLPLLEELGYVPKEKYASAPEILEHSRAIGRFFRLYDNACFSTRVTELRWDDADRRWIIATDRGDAMRARFVILSNGPLNRPKLPGIPGIHSFRGHTFHTSRWDYAYTGGTSEGGLDRLADKRVGIIGTGATAVQCIPHLGEAAGHLYVFQRTPSSVDVRANRPTDPDWAATLEPGWQRRRMENFNNLVSGRPEDEDLVNDGWTEIVRTLGMGARAKQRREQVATSLEHADYLKMEQIRARVDDVVADESTAEALKPYYRQFCKRPCFNDYYLQTFNRPNVTLVDTDGKGVERITERGVVVAGVEYELDCLVFATGFEVGTAYTQRAGYEIVGRDGITLTERWADGAHTLHGMHSRGFPNCLVFSGEQSGFTVNFPQMIDERARHAAYLLARFAADGVTMVEASQAAEDDWGTFVIEQARMAETYLENCTPGYYNNEGKPSERSRRNVSIDGMRFGGILERWRDDGTLAGLELSS